MTVARPNVWYEFPTKVAHCPSERIRRGVSENVSSDWRWFFTTLTLRLKYVKKQNFEKIENMLRHELRHQANYLSNVNMSNTWSMEEVNKKKKELDIMRFRLYEVKFDLTCEGHQNTSKTYFVNVLRCFDDHQMWPQNWPHYIGASLYQVLFFQTSFIVKLFKFLMWPVWTLSNILTCPKLASRDFVD